MKVSISFFTMLLLGLLVICPPLTGAEDGETLFKSKCAQCHTSGGEAPVFSPVKFASSQWERFFKRNKHKRKKDISGVISSADQESIKQYLIDHAADSDLPVAAGLK